ncbi:MAG: GDP-mannose 4,6-dehydratase, partial [Gammaproteobacteria bacterium]|nr:GDP-mannose 4,6-dehydratase [Gammaproteobacteria bacterium]
MNRTRRSILKAGAGAALALAAGRISAGEGKKARTLLILGGTGFIGPHLTEQALARGWKVTHFNRGRRDAEVENVETLLGDRKGQLDSLNGRRWDAVVDNTGYIPVFGASRSDDIFTNFG